MSLAKRQQAIDQQIAKVDDAWKATGHDFRRDYFESWKESQAASGCLMFARRYFTALTFYRSPFMGEQTEHGQITLENLQNVLTSMNTHEWCRRTEHAMEIAALKEMREFTKTPLSDLPEEEAVERDRSASGLVPPHAPVAEPLEGEVPGLELELMLDDILGPLPPEAREPLALGAEAAAAETVDIASAVCAEDPDRTAGDVAVAAGSQEVASEPVADTPTKESKEPEPAGVEPAAEAPPQNHSEGAASGHAAKKPKTKHEWRGSSAHGAVRGHDDSHEAAQGALS